MIDLFLKLLKSDRDFSLIGHEKIAQMTHQEVCNIVRIMKIILVLQFITISSIIGLILSNYKFI